MFNLCFCKNYRLFAGCDTTSERLLQDCVKPDFLRVIRRLMPSEIHEHLNHSSPTLPAMWEAIGRVARFAPIDSVMEIVGGAGTSDTAEVWAKGLRLNVRRPKYFCVEMSAIREVMRENVSFGAIFVNTTDADPSGLLNQIYGADFILLNRAQTEGVGKIREQLACDPVYDLIEDYLESGAEYSIFRRRKQTYFDPLPWDAPVHFFTIVYNGEPFIRHHLPTFQRLPFRWHWHIVEGVADLVHDTAWSVANGGRLPENLSKDGLSTDGTQAYLDEIAAAEPDRITVHRPMFGKVWAGKIAMVAEPVRHIFEDTILWQIDADELWTAEQIEKGRQLFLDHPEKAAAWFWCHYFVAENRVISTRHGYGLNSTFEWLRAWRFRPGMRWKRHEPPELMEKVGGEKWRNVAGRHDFTHRETEAAGLVFQHYGYATEDQVAFKETYYGYAGAVEAWRRLEKNDRWPVALRDYFGWVKDATEVDCVEALGVEPLARRGDDGRWTFAGERKNVSVRKIPSARIVVDGVFFQLFNTGIARVWLEVLKQWGGTEVGDSVCLLDREGTAPAIVGIRRLSFPRYDSSQPSVDALRLQEMCDALDAKVFISTYYTAPISTPSVAMIYDLIPEKLRLHKDNSVWQEKTISLFQANHITCISTSTANDLMRFHPDLPSEKVSVTLLAAPPGYGPRSDSAVEEFRHRFGLNKDYLLVIGERIGIRSDNLGYKNVALVFKAWSLLASEDQARLDLFCVGGNSELEPELRALAPEARVHQARLSDDDLPLAYAGAQALVYPSLYEGFGLPVIEAMACGCPVITCRNSSLGEIAGDAALFIDPCDPNDLAITISRLLHDSESRIQIVRRGLAQSRLFSYEKTAAELAGILNRVANNGITEKNHLTRIYREIGYTSEVKKRPALVNRLAAQKRLEKQLTETKVQLKDARRSVKRAEKHNAQLQKRIASLESRMQKWSLKHWWRRLLRKD